VGKRGTLYIVVRIAASRISLENWVGTFPLYVKRKSRHGRSYTSDDLSSAPTNCLLSSHRWCSKQDSCVRKGKLSKSMRQILTTKLKLLATPEQHHALRQTQLAYRDALNYVSQYAFEHGKTSNEKRLHQGTYHYIRARFKLPSEMTNNVIVP